MFESCRICGGSAVDARHAAREMMFGMGTLFHYAECATCGSLSLTDPPESYERHYPDGYYSFSNGSQNLSERIRGYLRGKRDRAYFDFESREVLGRLLARRYEDGPLLSVSKLRVGWEARILDVGCGSGSLLHRMAAVGFKNLAGVDPFLSNEHVGKNGVWIRKRRLEELGEEKYDVVMFHHSLEHVAEPTATLRAAARLLAADGICLIRVPVVAYAWKRYKTNWVQLDPPRHMWLPTERGMRHLVESVGLVVKRITYDSDAFQFWGSELCARGLPFAGLTKRNLGNRFRSADVKKFREQAASLNKEGNGDQAAFFLKRPA